MRSRETDMGAIAAAADAPRPRSRSRKAILLTWLRKTHLYLGLWGALLGLVFGATGILMNHRAVMKIPAEKAVQKTVQLPLPVPPPASPDALAAWLRSAVDMPTAQLGQVKMHPARPVVWAGQEVLQPARWTVSLQTPQRGVNAEYLPGNRFVKLEQLDATPIGTLMRLHTANGAGIFWVLLSDTIAGSLILLSVTGLLLWTQLHTVRTLAVAVSMAATLGAAWALWSV